MLDISLRAQMGESVQYRDFDLTRAEFRDDGDDGFNFHGVASVVDRAYSVRDQMGEFEETIEAGAFDMGIAAIRNANRKRKEVTDSDVALYVNHRHADVPMATTEAGTLTLDASPDLDARANLDVLRPDVIIARSAVNRGEMNQMSVGFRVNKGRDTWNADYTERVIHEVRLVEVSIVRRGANPYTSAGLRTFDEFVNALETGELDEADIMRGYEFFATKRATITALNEYAERDRADRERLERKRLIRA